MVTGPGVQQLAVLQVLCKQGQTRVNKGQQGLASSGEAFCKAPRRRQPKKRSFASGEKTLAPASVFMAARSRTGPGAQKKLTNPEQFGVEAQAGI